MGFERGALHPVRCISALDDEVCGGEARGQVTDSSVGAGRKVPVWIRMQGKLVDDRIVAAIANVVTRGTAAS